MRRRLNGRWDKMTLELQNIGMIKEAKVNIDGLTVIAGENDTGKSTLSKALYLIVNSMSNEELIAKEIQEKHNYISRRLNVYGKKIKENIFSKQSFKNDSSIKLLDGDKAFVYSDKFVDDTIYRKNIKLSSIVFIETPLVWNLQYLFRTSSDIESHLKMIGDEIDIPYPFLMKSLYFKLVTKQDYLEYWTDENINNIKSIMNGEFKKDEDGIFRFYRDDKKFDLVDIATGIKYFGILQVLLDNKQLNSYSLIVLDEPEVHLHPKWQLKMAELIVELVKNGVKVVVNSHSPYMIEALKRYSDRAKLHDKTNFYLAEGGYIENTNKLQEIYEKLSEPYDEFDRMDSDILNGK